MEVPFHFFHVATAQESLAAPPVPNPEGVHIQWKKKPLVDASSGGIGMVAPSEPAREDRRAVLKGAAIRQVLQGPTKVKCKCLEPNVGVESEGAGLVAQENVPATLELGISGVHDNREKFEIHGRHASSLVDRDSGEYFRPIEKFFQPKQFSNFYASPLPFRLGLFGLDLITLCRRSASLCQKRPNVTRLVYILHLLYYLLLCLYISCIPQYAPIWSSRAVTYPPTATQTTAEAA